MDIRSLQLFLSLSETLHFGRTSEACHLSPSALSRHIQHLESQLGVLLLLRDNRSVSLTQEGKKLQRYARDAIQQWETFRDTLLNDSLELQGDISLYCSVTASYSFLYDILSEFRRKHPKIALKLHTGDPALAIQRVLAGQEDIAIAAHPDKLPPQLSFKRIAVSPLVVIAPARDLMNPTLINALQNQDWEAIPMILPEVGVTRERLDQWHKAQHIIPNIYAQVAGHEAMVSMVGLGFGVGVVPLIVLENSPLKDRVDIIKPQPDLGSYEVGLCALNKRLKSPILKAFWYG